MIPIDRTEIEAWGKRHEAKGEFPFLISKLIFETTSRSTFFEVPSGSAVFLGGWDGIVHCKEETTFSPSGISLWEFKTNGGKSQADSDYEKRKKDSLGFDKSKATFIFVTTNNWTDKEAWVKERNEEQIWADVRVYDSTNIQNWLNITDITSKWFLSTILGRSYENCLTVEDFWEEWSIGPKGIKIVPELVLAGRETDSQQLMNFLQGEANLMAVRASTKDEAIAFIVATASNTGGQFKEQFFSKSLILENLTDFRVIKKNNSQLNLITKFEDTATLHSAVSRNHHVLLPLGPDDNFNSNDIIEPPMPDRDGQIEALIKTGLSKEDAVKFSREAGRDITILKKLLGFPLNKAKWENLREIRELIPALLIGRWDESVPGDIKIIERLSGKKYNTFSKKLNEWLEVESPPLIKIGNSWRLTSPLDAWTNLSNNLSTKDFENIKESFLEVMREINPTFEQEPSERQMAFYRGEVSKYSPWCREGLSQSMILIGLHGNKLQLQLQRDFEAQEWVDNVIKDLFFEASGDLWASRDSEMPLLAEASPKSFFEAAYYSLSLDDKPIMEMFLEEDNLLSPTSSHTGLLWALEGLAWTEEYVYDASLLLAKLSTLDPGGRLANRPIRSLSEIYKPWFYQTLASFEDRMKILENIIKMEPEIGWNLLCRMIPTGSGTAFPTHKLRWRLFERSFEPKATWPEVYATYSRVLDLLIENFDFTEKKLIDLLEISESKKIWAVDRDKVLSFIESILDKIIITNNSAWNKLRNFLSRHRSFAYTEWALPEKELKKYEYIYRKLEPSDPVGKVIWMFNNHWPNFPEGINEQRLSFRDREELVLKRRIEGLGTIYQQFGFQKVKELAKIVKEPLVYGDTLAYIIEEDSEIIMLCEYLKEDDSNILNFIQRFIFRKSIIHGIDWVFKLYEKLTSNEFSSTQLARIFYQVEQLKKVWEFLEKTSTETENSYWKSIYPNFWDQPEDDLIYGIDKLMEVNRFISALDIVYHKPEKLPSKKLVDVLKKAGTQESEEEKRLDSYHVTRIFEVLGGRDDVDKSELPNLEWLYLPILASYGSTHKPEILHQELAQNPVFFMEVLTLIYKSDNKEEEERERDDISDEAKQNRGRNAYELLRSWNQIPGVDKDEKINEDFLWDWIKKVREKANQSGRLEIADTHIGQVLAEYPETEKTWPPKEICKVIESINTKSLKSGFSSATFNKRGSSTRGPFDGGDIERGHAKYFRSLADQIKYDFPKTAEILNQLADGYERDAKRMDEMAEKDKLDY